MVKRFTNITNFMRSTTNGIREGLVKKVINIAKIISVYKMSRPNVQKILYKNVQLVCLLYVVF